MTLRVTIRKAAEADQQTLEVSKANDLKR